MEIKFFVRMRGARTPPPMIEDPVMRIPLREVRCDYAGRGKKNTMLLLQPRGLCRVRCLSLPRHEVTRLREIAQPILDINLYSHRIFHPRTYIESFPVASEQHICKGQSKKLNQRPLPLQAPITANVVVAPPRPYLKLILPAQLQLDW